MELYQFNIKIRPPWDNGKVVEKFSELSEEEIKEGKEPENIGYEVVFETEPDTRVIKIQMPLSPSTYAQVIRHMTNKESELAGDLILSQYMVCEDDDEKALRERILKDGRLMFSCLDGLAPIFDLCEVELKKG